MEEGGIYVQFFDWFFESFAVVLNPLKVPEYHSIDQEFLAQSKI